MIFLSRTVGKKAVRKHSRTRSKKKKVNKNDRRFTIGLFAGLLLLAVSILGTAVVSDHFLLTTSAAVVNPVVQSYEQTITEYAEENGIREYVPLIEAVMMQESGGRGTDPMQASESGYNTLYENTPGSIRDPEYSISVGVQTLKQAISLAGCRSVSDIERIRLALQGYNYGPGYITWAQERDGGYSEENSAAFSEMKAEELGWDSYGDPKYAEHVLRYYTLQ